MKKIRKVYFEIGYFFTEVFSLLGFSDSDLVVFSVFFESECEFSVLGLLVETVPELDRWSVE